jgi:uncharacterized protein YwlG (UPF0340 family)
MNRAIVVESVRFQSGILICHRDVGRGFHIKRVWTCPIRYWQLGELAVIILADVRTCGASVG